MVLWELPSKITTARGGALHTLCNEGDMTTPLGLAPRTRFQPRKFDDAKGARDLAQHVSMNTMRSLPLHRLQIFQSATVSFPAEPSPFVADYLQSCHWRSHQFYIHE